MSNNGGLGLSNPIKDYDVLYKIVLIGDSGWFSYFAIKIEPITFISY